MFPRKVCIKSLHYYKAGAFGFVFKKLQPGTPSIFKIKNPPRKATPRRTLLSTPEPANPTPVMLPHQPRPPRSHSWRSGSRRSEIALCSRTSDSLSSAPLSCCVRLWQRKELALIHSSTNTPPPGQRRDHEWQRPADTHLLRRRRQ